MLFDKKRQKDMIQENSLLGKEGLTITAAGHLANVAKEMYESLSSKLEGLTLFSKEFTLANNGNTYKVSVESSKKDWEEAGSIIEEIGLLKFLIAYLREGIKAKQNLESQEAIDDYLANLVIDGKKVFEEIEPAEEVSFETEFNKFDAGRKAEYFSLEARCAEIGKCIHPSGEVSEARKAYYNALKHPTTVNGLGTEKEIYSNSSSFTSEEVDSVFFSLQKEYRALQCRLNAIKTEIEKTVSDKALKNSSARYNAAKERILLKREWFHGRKLHESGSGILNVPSAARQRP